VLEAVQIADGKNSENFGAENEEGPWIAWNSNTVSTHRLKRAAAAWGASAQLALKDPKGKFLRSDISR
jgi:hypothetical protein